MTVSPTAAVARLTLLVSCRSVAGPTVVVTFVELLAVSGSNSVPVTCATFWTGVSAGVLKIAGTDTYARLAAVYFIVGIIVIIIRGYLTQWITRILIARGGHTETFARFDEMYESGHIQGAKSTEGSVL